MANTGMRKYCKLSSHCVLDMRTLAVVPMSRVLRDSILYVPNFLEAPKSDIPYKEITSLSFKGVAIRWSEDLTRLMIEFLAVRQMGHHSITVESNRVADVDILRLFGIYRQSIKLNVDGFTKDTTLELDKGSYKFDKIAGLYQYDIGAWINKFILFSGYKYSGKLVWVYGMSTAKQTIHYKTHQLKEKFYVFMFGFVAILLEDDLTMAGVVLLSGQTKGHVYIGQIVYGVNPYLVRLLLVDK